jgi:pilus assembly protein CpaB
MAERRYSLVFYAAVLVAAAATYGVYLMLQRTREANRVATAPVVVALKDMPEGATIDRTSIATNAWPLPTIPAGAFSSSDSVVGRVTRVAVFAGEPIVPGRLAPNGTGPGLEVKITPGKRAMAIRINDVAGISGLIQPNSRVDVMVTMKNPEKDKPEISKLFMENMRVLSVGTEVHRGADGKPINATTATLEVTPQEAERLAAATTQGSIQLVLRGYGDPDSVKTAGATPADILTGFSAPAPSRPAPRVRYVSRPVQHAPPAATPEPRAVVPDSMVVKVYRGDKVSQQKFSRTDSTAKPETP